MQPPSTPRDLVALYAKRTKKQFGQHFLTDSVILERIADIARVQAGDHVLEIGPGCGTLTWELLRRGAHVTAVEIDRDAAAFLRQSAFPDHPRFDLVEGDALALDLSCAMAAEGGIKVVSNLPYNVGTQIMFSLAQHAERIDQMALMFQLEVARRLCADPSQRKAYGSLSLMAQLDFDLAMGLRLPPGAFYPPPKVKSAVVHFRPVPGSRIPDGQVRSQFEKLVRTAFNQRRKTLVNAVKPLGFDRQVVLEALEAQGIDPRARPEVLGFDAFAELARRLVTSHPR